MATPRYHQRRRFPVVASLHAVSSDSAPSGGALDRPTRHNGGEHTCSSHHVLPRNLRRRRLPCLALGSLLASSKTCDGFCTSRVRSGAVPRATPFAPTTTNNRRLPTPIGACVYVWSSAGFASNTADSIQTRGLCLSFCPDDDNAENNTVEKISANPSLDVDENDTLPSVTSTATATTRNNVSAIQRVRILSYRTVLSASSLVLTVLAIFDSDILSGTGVDGASIIDWLGSVLPITAGMTLLLAPVPNVFGRATLNFLGIILLASMLPVASNILEATSSGAVGDVQRVLIVLSLMSICVREIYYFGVAYKVEAVIALVTLPLTLVMASDPAVGFSLPVCALAMDVLAAGKIFEPCAEDFERSNSEFLVGGN